METGWDNDAFAWSWEEVESVTGLFGGEPIETFLHSKSMHGTGKLCLLSRSSSTPETQSAETFNEANWPPE